MHLDGKVERHKKRTRFALYHSASSQGRRTTREHVAQVIVVFVASTTLSLSLLAAEMTHSSANATSNQIMSPNGTIHHLQTPVLTSQPIKLNATSRQPSHNHLRRPSQVEPARQPRVYRIRAAGSNGQFATNAALRVGAPPSEHSASNREIEESNTQLNGTTTTTTTTTTTAAEQQQFGARQPSRVHATKLVSHQKCTHQQQAPQDGETTAEASSISASSQTLQLERRPSGSASRQVVAVQQQQHRHRPAMSGGGGGGEIEESGWQPAAQQAVAANERSQSLAAAADTSGGPLPAAEAATEIERQTGAHQQTEQVEPNNNNNNLLSLIDEFDSKITTNKTRAQLSCDSGEMVIKLNFTEPFKGIVYPDHNRLSPCRFFGDGHHNYELRLPLRGCGTRQVAPRVFVNDVIVRFHKTLELEEDEVKTLICRYPPPLDITTSGSAAGQQVAAGNGLVHELDNRQHEQRTQHSSRPGESALQPNQFELLEPTSATSGSGRPTNRFGSGGASQLETNALGELLAPPGGQHRQPIGDLINLTPAERILLRQHAKSASGLNDNLLMSPSLGSGGGGGSASGNQQRTNSRLFNPEATSVLLDERGNLVRAAGNSTGPASANYFDRLTSIELLFLISSLMFLVLLALGLAGSYFCLSGRRDRRRRHARSVGAISPQTGGSGGAGLLQRKRRHFSPTSASLYRTAAGGHLAGAGSRYQSPSGQLIAHQHHYANQQHAGNQQLYNPVAHRPAYYYQQYLAQAQSQNQPPSSPNDSDVSGQMLLPSGNGGGGSAPSGGDTTMTSRLASALGGPNLSNATQVGRRFNYPAPAHYHASTLRPSRSHRQPENSHEQQEQPVVGRRGPHTNHHHHHQQDTTSPHRQYQANAIQQGTATLGRRAGRPAGAQANSFARTREPLLKMAPPFPAPPPPVSSHARNPVSANQTLARMRHARSLQQLREQDDVTGAPQLHGHFGGEHAFGADWLRHNQVLVGASSGAGNKPVQRHCSVHARHSHQPNHLNDHKIKLKQQQHHYDTSNLTQAPVVTTARPEALVAQEQSGKSLGARTRQQQVASINYADDDLGDATSSSDHSSTCSSEPITVNERLHQQVRERDDLKSERPKLILKSIEDSFVTNFTEIYEQEYRHLDTRRPLSMGEWRRASETGRAAGRVLSASSGESSDEAEGKGGEEVAGAGTHKSSRTNLRSLTELDVNFAKSLLRPSLAAAAATTTASRQHSEQKEAPPPENNDDEREEQLVRHPQQPSVANQQTSKPPNNNNNNNNDPGEQENVKAETPDLVISPEYNVGQRLRLASGSRSSPGAESISYV